MKATPRRASMTSLAVSPLGVHPHHGGLGSEEQRRPEWTDLEPHTGQQIEPIGLGFETEADHGVAP